MRTASIIFTVFKGHFKAWRRNKTTLFWTLAFPLLLMLLFGGLFSLQSDKMDLYIENNDMNQDSPSMASLRIIQLINQTKKLKFFSITSFNEKNIKNIYLLKKKLILGLIFSSTTSIKRIIKKSKLKYTKILVMHKGFLSKKKLDTINKPIYYYTATNKKIRKKYSNKNLIFENL